MKAAVLTRFGLPPKFEEADEPETRNPNEVILYVKAASVKNLDKARASGTHYASYEQLPAIAGIDAVGVLEDGTKVYAQGLQGTLAEKTLIDKNNYTRIPENLDFATAAALPNAVIGATMALLFRADFQKGQTVLVNGATGVTGQLLVQVAKYYKAGQIIVTGRNPEALRKLKHIGADDVISLQDKEEDIISQLKKLHKKHPVDIVIDYIWGRPAELVLTALKGGGLHNYTHKTKVITAGAMAGENISLSSGFLRSSAIEILGSGIGSLSKEEMVKFHKEILPEMFALAVEGHLTINTECYPLESIEKVWDMPLQGGKRLVITI